MKQQLLSGILAIVLFSTVSLPLAEAATYKVQPGDNLYRIAQKHKVSVSDIKSWNKLKNDSIYVNQSLSIGNTASPAPAKAKAPVKAKAPAKASTPASSANAGYSVHYVQKGESLYSLAKKYGVTTDQIISWNKLSSTNIFVNQALKINSGKVQQPAKVIPVSAEKPKPAAIAAPVTKNASSVYAAAIKTAYALEGTPYLFGGATPAGFDCSGFIHYVYSQAGLQVSRTDSIGFYNQSTEISNPVFGDLVFFENTYKAGISHMGIFVGNNSFIHAGSKGIEISRLDIPYWEQRFAGFKRLNVVK